MSYIKLDQLKSIAQKIGLLAVGVTDFTPLNSDKNHLEKWQNDGFAGSMSYMKRSPDQLTDPSKLLPSGQSIVSFGLEYDRSFRPKLEAGHGAVARYAWGSDYHEILPKYGANLINEIEKLVGRKVSYRIFTDAVPLLERAIAKRGGSGFIGKNTMLIKPGNGSFFFIGEVLLDVAIEVETQNQKWGCGTCFKCGTDCPTQAFEGPYRLNANKCISYLTIEHRGIFTRSERKMIENWIFGCDICQEVCPFNFTAIKKGDKGLECFDPTFGIGPSISLSELFKIKNNIEFETRYKGTPILRARRGGLIRNGLCVAVNSGAVELSSLISDLCFDPSPIIRAHAVWAHYELLGRGATLRIANKLIKDSDSRVVLEVRDILQE